VCSLLRTEIIRGLELPRFGLQIIPYEGGCTMMRNGEHLALYDNHDALRREIARHSKRDAEAYERYLRDMLRQCRFIKPLLLREPPDPTSFKPRDIMELLHLGKHFHGLGEERMYDTLGSIDGTVGAWGFARGGMGAVTKALAASFEASGGTIRSGAPVARVLVRNEKAIGVVLDGGEEIHAPVVVSNLDVRRTFLETMAAKDLPLEFVEQVRNF